MEEKLKMVLSKVLDIDISLINENTKQVNIFHWDSLKQMSLIIAIEEEFGIKFDDDIFLLNSYSLIKDKLFKLTK